MIRSLPRMRTAALLRLRPVVGPSSSARPSSRPPPFSSSTGPPSSPCPLPPSTPLHSSGRIRADRRRYANYRILESNRCGLVVPQCDRPRHFSSPADDDDDDGKKKKKDLGETVRRLQDEASAHDEGGAHDGAKGSGDDEPPGEPNPHLERLASMGASFLSSVSDTWGELVASGRAKDINKRIGPVGGAGGKPNYADDDEAADKYEAYKGSRDVMVVDPREELSAWERMERRLRDAPIIQDILERSGEAYERSGAKARVEGAREKVQHLREDAEEAWETSQNPWVYRASSVYDTLTAESEFAAASRQLRELDPDFAMETWKRDVVEHTLPNIMKLFLEGRIQELKPWLGEAVYNRLAAEGRARKKEGVQMDTNVLAIMNAEILACELGGSSVNVERGDDPIILLHFMCQQIHCVRKKARRGEKGGGDGTGAEGGAKEGGGGGEDPGAEGRNDDDDEGTRTYAEDGLGEIVEGSEDDIRANSYVIAFQREYNEERMELNWKIVDFRFNGAIAYL